MRVSDSNGNGIVCSNLVDDWLLDLI